jgi:hypothetical protein
VPVQGLSLAVGFSVLRASMPHAPAEKLKGLGMTKQNREPLEIVARKIVQLARSADDHIINAALLLKEAKQRVEAGEAGKGVKWPEWAEKNIDLGETRIRELVRIAEAKDALAELERQREMTRERVERHRVRKSTLRNAANLEEPRRTLVDWARKTPLDDKRWTLIDWARKASDDEVLRLLARVSVEPKAFPAPANQDKRSTDAEAVDPLAIPPRFDRRSNRPA